MSNTKAVVFYLLARVSIRLPFYFMLWMADYVYTLHRIASRRDVKKHLSVPFSNAIFRGIIATERCCFAQLLKVYIPYRIGAFSRRYGKLSGMV